MAAIRPHRSKDADAIAALTVGAIRTTALRAYCPSQVEASAARYWVQRLLHGATKADVILVAADADDRAIATTLLEAGGHLGMLFCHPDHAGKGLGLALLA